MGAGGPLAAGMSLCSGVCHHRPRKSRAHQFCERERAWRGTPPWGWGRHQNGGETLKEIGLSAWKGPNHQLIQVGTSYRGVMPVLSSTAAIMANGTYRTGRNRYRRNCASGDSSNSKNNVCRRLYSLVYSLAETWRAVQMKWPRVKEKEQNSIERWLQE